MSPSRSERVLAVDARPTLASIPRKPALVAALAAVILSVACSSGESGGASAAAVTQDEVGAQPIAVAIAKPDRRDITDRLTLAGTVTPYEQATLYAKVTGYLKSINVDIGDRVRQGDLLAEIDVPEMDASLEEKRAGVIHAEARAQQAQAAINQYHSELEFQQTNFKRLSAIRERDPDVLPQQDVDQARAALGVAESKVATAQADVQVAEAAIAAARAELETMNRLAEYARITAPLRGVVTERFVDPGELVQAAASSRTQAAPIVSLARVDRVRIAVDVPERSAPFVRRGTQASITLEGLPGRTISAKVARTGTVLNPGTRTMRVEFDVPNGNLLLRPGMTASVTLDLRTIEGAITVPVSAIQSSRGEQTVFVFEQGLARRRVVTTGLQSPEWIQIVDGLSGEEQVIVTAGGTLTDETPVTAGR